MTHPPVDFSPLLRHLPGKVALLFSGGKESLVLFSLLQPFLDGIVLVHNDTSDLMPETSALVDRVARSVPHFAKVQSNSPAWIAANAMPSDLVPSKCSAAGMLHRKEGKQPIVTMYECCNANRWVPISNHLAAGGYTLHIIGQREEDVRQFDNQAWRDGMMGSFERWSPIKGWSEAQVFRYLEAIGAELPRYYSFGVKGPECSRCSASWSEQRAKYLRRFHPALADGYEKRLRVIASEIDGDLAALRSEMGDL